MKTGFELLREATRIYIERKTRWNQVFAKTSRPSDEQALTEKNVLDEIGQYRRHQALRETPAATFGSRFARRVGHRADRIPAGTVARPTCPLSSETSYETSVGWNSEPQDQGKANRRTAGPGKSGRSNRKRN